MYRNKKLVYRYCITISLSHNISLDVPSVAYFCNRIEGSHLHHGLLKLLFRNYQRMSDLRGIVSVKSDNYLKLLATEWWKFRDYEEPQKIMITLLLTFFLNIRYVFWFNLKTQTRWYTHSARVLQMARAVHRRTWLPSRKIKSHTLSTVSCGRQLQNSVRNHCIVNTFVSGGS